MLPAPWRCPIAGVGVREPDFQKDLSSHASGVRDAITGIVKAASNVKGELYDLDSDDPNIVAERELLNAAKAIEAAAKKLAELKPKTVEINLEGTFHDTILEACKAIASATGALLSSARQAQNEISAKERASGKAAAASGKKYREDSTWKDGLVSAAKVVAAATTELAAKANDLVAGDIEEEYMIAAAKQVSAATAQLVTASRVKSDPNSAVQKKLGGAAKLVAQATSKLVKAARDADLGGDSATAFSDLQPTSAVAARARKVDAQAKVLKLERELERARKHVGAVHRSGYK
jgi:talin